MAAVHGLLKMIGLAGFPSLIPALVPEDGLARANALGGISFGLASLTGAALAGVGVATVGAAPVVAFDAAGYVALALALLSVRRPSPAACPTEPTAADRTRKGVADHGSRGVADHTRQGIADIIRLAATHPVLRTSTITFALFNVGAGCLLVFLPHRAADLGPGTGGYGYLVAAMTGGELAAGVVLARRSRRWPLPLPIVVAQAAAAMAVAVLVVPSTASTVAALVLFGLRCAPMTAWAQTLRMQVVPPAAHGRLFALLRTTMQAAPPLGAGLGALVVPHGAAVTVPAIAALTGLPALPLGPRLLRGASPGRRRRRRG